MTALSSVVLDGSEDVKTDHGLLSKALQPTTHPPNFQSVAVCNSSGVHFGNKTYIDHVTIKQFINGETSDKKTSCNGEQQTSEPPPPPVRTWKGLYIPHGIKQLHKKCGISVGAGIASIIILGGVIIAVTVLLLQKRNETEVGSYSPISRWTDDENLNKNIPIKTDIDKVLLVAKKLRMISRLQWLAQPPSGVLDNLTIPVPNVVIAHTVTVDCNDQASCTFQVRNIQTYHIESLSFYDIGYNFLVGGDGAVYEGRGWDYVGAHTKNYNSLSIGIAFIGTFNSKLPPERQLVAAKNLLELGVAQGKLSKDYKLFGHRQLMGTLSPGNALFDEIKKWDHFSENL